MKRFALGLGLLTVAFACSEQAGQVLIDAGEIIRDAGDADASTGVDGSTGGNGMATGGTSGSGGSPQAQIIEVDCSKAVNGFVLTDVDQRDFGQVIIHSTWPDPWGVTDPPRNVDYQSDAFWSIDGKVLVQCSGNTIRAWLEIR